MGNNVRQCDKVVTASGGSLSVNLTKELKTLGIGKGDIVRITIAKIE